MTRFPVLLALVVVVAACQSRVPDSAPERVQRERPAATGLVPDRPVISERLVRSTEPRGTQMPEGMRQSLDSERESGEQVAQADGVAADGGPGNGQEISDSQDFEAITARRTREEDAERLRRLSENYEVIEAEPLPPRDEGMLTIVEFALATRHPVGQKMYRRGFLGGLFGSKCDEFRDPDHAQTVFLEEGGPWKDKLGLDRDGDGFVCGWSPEPFRRMAQ